MTAAAERKKIALRCLCGKHIQSRIGIRAGQLCVRQRRLPISVLLYELAIGRTPNKIGPLYDISPEEITDVFVELAEKLRKLHK